MKSKFLSGAAVAALCFAIGSTAAQAQSLNRCWGEIASQIAKMDTSGVNANGGGMGVHSRAAAGQGDTFGDGFGFNTLNADGNHGRQGVGNVSDGPPHNLTGESVRGNSFNGQHAINNSNAGPDNVTSGNPAGGFSNIIDPLTAEFGPNDSDLHCSLEDQGGVP